MGTMGVFFLHTVEPLLSGHCYDHRCVSVTWRYLYYRSFWYTSGGCGNVFWARQQNEAGFMDLSIAVHS